MKALVWSCGFCWLLLFAVFGGSNRLAQSEEASTPPQHLWKALPLLPAAITADGLPAAETIDLDALESSTKRVDTPTRLNATLRTRKADGYPLVLSGHLSEDLVLGPEHSPVLIEGALVVPTGKTLYLKPGTRLVLRKDPAHALEAEPNTPDPSKQGILWIDGQLMADGLSGSRIEISAPEEPGALFFYGTGSSEVRGMKLQNAAVLQSGNRIRWLGCSFRELPHYALATGAASFLHCDFEQCGGMLATYDAGPWSLVLLRNNFKSCREGLAMSVNPGQHALFVKANNFMDTQGANLRVFPIARSNQRHQEFLIGENYYGTNAPERIDAKIVDMRADRGIKARINIRPPAEFYFPNAGMSVSATQIAQTLLDFKQPLEQAEQAYLKTQQIKNVTTASR